MSVDSPIPLANELDRQRVILRREMPERILLTTLGLSMCAIFANPWTVALIWALYVALEVAGNWLLFTHRMMRSRLFYGLALAQSVLVEAAYMSAPGLVWHVEDPYSKAIAVGLTAMTLMHLASVRSIHLPIGIAGLTGVAITTLVFNTAYWLAKTDPVGLALSSVAIFGAMAYSFTAMLSNNRLHRSMAASEAVARAANEAKTLFLAQMSHEFRTPLNAIIGMGQAELALAEAASQDRLRTLVESARMLAVILDDVSDMNAVSHGRLSLRLRIIDLSIEIENNFAGFQDRAKRLGIGLAIRADGPLPEHAEIDPVRLRQSLGNLLSNALRHAHCAQISVTYRFVPGPTPTTGLLQFEVADTGPGVAFEEREAIFDAFHKGRVAAPGSGLGLAIARTLARRMGGDLVLLPTANGAHFRLSIACAIATPPPPRPQSLPDLTGRMILIVDDIASNRLSRPAICAAPAPCWFRPQPERPRWRSLPPKRWIWCFWI